MAYSFFGGRFDGLVLKIDSFHEGIYATVESVVKLRLLPERARACTHFTD